VQESCATTKMHACLPWRPALNLSWRVDLLSLDAQQTKSGGKLILAGGMVLFAIAQSLLFVVIAPLAQSVGMSEVLFGVLLTIGNLPLIFAAPFWGRKSDIWGRKPIFLVGLFGSGVGTLLIALVLQGAIDGWYPVAWVTVMFALARAAYSATATAVYPSSSGYIADVTDRAGRAQGMAVIGGANSLGGVLGPAIGGGLAFLGLLVPMYAVAALTLLGGFWALVYLKEPARHADTRKLADVKISDPRLRPFMIMWACFFLVFISLNVVTAFYIRERFGITDPQEVAQITARAFIAMAAVIVTIQIGVFQIFRPSPAVLLRLFGPLFVIALLTIALAPTLTIMTVGYGMIGLGFSCATPGLNGGASLSVEPHEQGAAAGYLAAATTVGPILGPIAGPALFTLGPSVPMLAGAALFGVLSIYALTVRIPEP